MAWKTGIATGAKPSPAAGHGAIPLSLGMMLVTMGVVYGDIGTSPMYTLKAIVADNGGIQTAGEPLVLGSLSLIIWTLTLITTVKYVLIAMRADNHYEGGIFALYSLVRRYGKWLILPAMVGGAALLADGILTPAVTVTTAIEGLRTIDVGAEFLGEGQQRVILITIAIICALFLVQRAGTSMIGRAFGPIMCAWFAFLGVTGVINLIGNPGVLRALNPVYGIAFLLSPDNHAGVLILGFVFLATTGAEALYSDMGHVGKHNVYATWPMVKVCLLLNYLGQGAWLLANAHDPALAALEEVNPFFQMLAPEARPFAVGISTLAAIIASQALITGSFTLVSEAMRLDLMPHLLIRYPAETKGQLYIPLVNGVMWVGCVGVVLLFRTSSHMEAAYGLAITLTMLMTTLLLTTYLRRVQRKPRLAAVFLVAFGAIEAVFFLSSLTKFLRGGYVTVLMAAAIFYVMFVWRRGTAIEQAQTVFLPIGEYLGQLRRLSGDIAQPITADNLVFLTKACAPGLVDRDVLYSILDRHPKRARAYWFVNVSVTDEPFTHTYTVDSFGSDFVFKVQLQLGYKMDQRVSAYLRHIVADLEASGELPAQHHPYSIYERRSSVGDFRFCMLHKVLMPETELRPQDRRVITAKYAIRAVCSSQVRWFGLDTSTVLVEHVPLFARTRPVVRLTRLRGEAAQAVQLRAHEAERDMLSAGLDEMKVAARTMISDVTQHEETVELEDVTKGTE